MLAQVSACLFVVCVYVCLPVRGLGFSALLHCTPNLPLILLHLRNILRRELEQSKSDDIYPTKVIYVCQGALVQRFDTIAIQDIVACQAHHALVKQVCNYVNFI